jgi:hypothetical protein
MSKGPRMPVRFEVLADYNGEVSRGISHTANMAACMTVLQADFDAWSYKTFGHPLPSEHPAVKYNQIRTARASAFRSGEWAHICDVVRVNERPCFVVEFSDGKIDFWPVEDPLEPYEFRHVD